MWENEENIINLPILKKTKKFKKVKKNVANKRMFLHRVTKTYKLFIIKKPPAKYQRFFLNYLLNYSAEVVSLSSAIRAALPNNLRK